VFLVSPNDVLIPLPGTDGDSQWRPGLTLELWWL